MDADTQKNADTAGRRHDHHALKDHRAPRTAAAAGSRKLGLQASSLHETVPPKSQGPAEPLAVANGKQRSKLGPVNGLHSSSSPKGPQSLSRSAQVSQRTSSNAGSPSSLKPDKRQPGQEQQQRSEWMNAHSRRLDMRADPDSTTQLAQDASRHPQPDAKSSSRIELPEWRSSNGHSSPISPDSQGLVGNGLHAGPKSHDGRQDHPAAALPTHKAQALEPTADGICSDSQFHGSTASSTTASRSGLRESSDDAVQSSAGYRQEPTGPNSAGDPGCPQVTHRPDNLQASVHLQNLLQRSLHPDAGHLHELGRTSSCGRAAGVSGRHSCGGSNSAAEGPAENHESHSEAAAREEHFDITIQHVSRAVGPAAKSLPLVLFKEPLDPQAPSTLSPVSASPSARHADEHVPSGHLQAGILAESVPGSRMARPEDSPAGASAQAAGVPTVLSAGLPTAPSQPAGVSEPDAGPMHAAAAAAIASTALCSPNCDIAESSRPGQDHVAGPPLDASEVVWTFGSVPMASATSRSPADSSHSQLMKSPRTADANSAGPAIIPSPVAPIMPALKLEELPAIRTRLAEPAQAPPAHVPMSAEQQLFAGMQGYNQRSLPPMNASLNFPTNTLDSARPGHQRSMSATEVLPDQAIAAQLARHPHTAIVELEPTKPPPVARQIPLQVPLLNLPRSAIWHNL